MKGGRQKQRGQKRHRGKNVHEKSAKRRMGSVKESTSNKRYNPAEHKPVYEDNQKDADGTGEDSDVSEEVSAYQQLISTIPSATTTAPVLSESEDESEEDEDNRIDGDKVQVEEGSEDEASHQDAESSEQHPVSDDDDEEEEEGEDAGADESDQDDSESDVDDEDDGLEESMKDSDPFCVHFEQDIEEDVVSELEKGSSGWTREEIKIPLVGRSQLQFPAHTKPAPINTREKDLHKLHVRPKICSQVASTNRKHAKVDIDSTDSLTPLQHKLFSIINSYKDLYYPERNHHSGEEIRLTYCLHAINHVLKTRKRVIDHNSQIKSKKTDASEEFQDQGLTRPKVLIVVPFRDSALKVVTMMMKLLMPKDQSFVTNKRRFMQEYSADEAERHGKKPEDYEKIFTGNIDDHFRVGLGVAKKTLKIYTEFYSSDIIVASPLGLRTVIGVEGEEKRDFDFLSSIELLIFDQADIFLMQNWDHIMHLMDHLHIQPKESHGVDFSRVRMWTLNGWSKWYRQTLIFSDIVTPEINAIFNKHCHNYAGKVLVPKVHVGSSIQQIVVSLPQVFKRIEVSSYGEVPDARFKFFKEKVLPDYLDQVMAQTLIVIPSYFDFVRVRNYLKKEELDFVQLSEYSKDASISRARSQFYHGKTHMMLYTERLHFFRRFVIRGIKHLIFYELPQYSHFYSEICNMMVDARRHTDDNSATCTVLYTKYDAQRLAAVVGTDRASHMISADKSIFMFVTGDDQ